ncbi:MAG: DUF1491 family protein [Sphingomonas sp.]|nr:DUF1491 family protein [Sphingomonas sp.]
MSERLPTHVLVGALLRRVNDAGGMAMVLAKGDADAGALLLITGEKGQNYRALERGVGPDGASALVETGPSGADPTALTDYWQRRRTRDPDLWVIELDIAQAERFAAETIGFY